MNLITEACLPNASALRALRFCALPRNHDLSEPRRDFDGRLHHEPEVVHEVNALLGGYRVKPDPQLDRTKVVRIAKAILNGLFNHNDSKKKETTDDE